ncbi:MAG: hypothetical protein M0Q92_06135 [Methanoregula sp.]|nr:hypothetical protein [Methanoregula sp.]
MIGQQIFVEAVRVDMVPHPQDLQENGVAGLEDLEVVAGVRVVRVLLPSVAHLLRELLCVADGCEGFVAAGHMY